MGSNSSIPSPNPLAIRDLESVLAPVCGSASRTPDDEVVEASINAKVQRALTALPHAYKVVVVLADLERYTYKETSGSSYLACDCALG